MSIAARLTFSDGIGLVESIQAAENLGCRVISASAAGPAPVLTVELDTVQTGDAVAFAVLDKVLSFRVD